MFNKCLKLSGFLIVIVIIGCSQTSADVVSITGIPDWVKPYYAVITVLDNDGEIIALSNSQSVGENEVLFFELNDVKGNPWSGKKRTYTVSFEIYTNNVSTNDIINGRNEDSCFWFNVELPLNIEYLSISNVNRNFEITDNIDNILNNFEVKINEHASIINRVMRGDLFALMEGTVVLREAQFIMYQVMPYAERMNENQALRFQSLMETLQSNMISF